MPTHGNRRRVWELLQTKSPESEYILNSVQVVDPRAESASPSPQVKSTTGRITRTGSEARPASVVVQPGTATGAFSLSTALKSAMEDIGSDLPPAVSTPPNQSWRASLKPHSKPAGPSSQTPPPPRLQQNQPGMIAGGSQNPTLPQNKPLKMVPRTSNPVEPSSTLQNTRTSGTPVTLSLDLSHSPSVMKASMKLKQPACSQLKHITPNVSMRYQTTEQKNEEMLERVSRESLSRVQAAILKFSSGSSAPTTPFTIYPQLLAHYTPTHQSPASSSLTPSRPSQSLPSSPHLSPASSLL
ncbi:hypothetical protein BLNAU_3487 [Blattamonas nauphoetae]|uniref:Uncharacterized protein n=1 Tax=Blattamonas nauphoetae TaxID=2049346 RepID=A0ABQ9YD80_9EUKA|nr:hypothetical protein BLNAU_3487 [Blattamonas nauphoetae]